MPKAAFYDRDKLMNADKTSVAKLCVKCFDRIQDYPKELQTLALAGAFILMCNATAIPAQDAFTAVKNLMADPLEATGLDPRFGAMSYHLKTELLKD